MAMAEEDQDEDKCHIRCGMACRYPFLSTGTVCNVPPCFFCWVSFLRYARALPMHCTRIRIWESSPFFSQVNAPQMPCHEDKCIGHIVEMAWRGRLRYNHSSLQLTLASCMTRDYWHSMVKGLEWLADCERKRSKVAFTPNHQNETMKWFFWVIVNI